MAVTALGTIKENIRTDLAILTTLVKLNTAVGHTDINHEAEDFYCGLLNRAFGWNLKNQNALQMNFPAIDLGDLEAELPGGKKGVAVQVTSTEGRTKVQKTLDKFFENHQEKTFKRLIILIIGEKPGYRDDFTLKGTLDFDKDEDIWDTEELLKRIDALKEDRLEAVADYLREQLPFHRAKTRIMDLPLHSAMPAGGFIGREDLLDEIAENLDGGTKPVFLTGLGGMGKTELAVKFGRQYRLGNVYLASFQDSFRKTLVQNVAAGIPGLLDQKLKEDEIYQRVLHYLGKLSDQDLLIIDNADGNGTDFTPLMDEAYDALCALDAKLIITTRCPRPMAVKVDTLEKEQLRQLFVKHEVDISMPDMDRLIEFVRSHTMTVDLMARTMAESFVTVEQMLTAMATGGMDEDFEAVGTFHKETREQKRIDGHLLALFRVTDVDENAQKLLSCAILLPQGGMDYDTFKKALPEGASGAINGQVKRGWLSRDHDTRLVTIHPVLRLVCRKALENWQEICPEFLTRLHEQFEEKNFKQGIYGQIAQTYLAATAEVPEKTAMWHFRAGWYLWKQGQYKEALECELHALKVRENTLAADDLLIADSCNDLGIVYGYLGQHENALGVYQRAYDIRREKLTDKHRKTAHSCNNVGDAYFDSENFDQALVYQKIAMNTFEEILQPDDPDLATSYNHVGLTYAELGNHPKALKYYEKALEIRKQVLPENHPALAVVYNNMGLTHSDLGDYKAALKYMDIALAIRKRAHPEDHPEIADSLYNLAALHNNQAVRMKVGYFQKKEFKTALGYVREALQVVRNSPSGTHRWLEDMKQLEKLLKSFVK